MIKKIISVLVYIYFLLVLTNILGFSLLFETSDISRIALSFATIILTPIVSLCIISKVKFCVLKIIIFALFLVIYFPLSLIILDSEYEIAKSSEIIYEDTRKLVIQRYNIDNWEHRTYEKLFLDIYKREIEFDEAGYFEHYHK